MDEVLEKTQEVVTPEQETEEEEKVVSETTEEETEETEEIPEVSVESIVSETKKPKKKGVQSRIDELTREKYEAKRESDLLRKKLEEKAETPVVTSDRPMPPAESDFIEPVDYKKARVSYEDDLDAWKSKHRESTEAQERQQKELTENIAKFNENAVKMRDKYPDFDKVISEPLFTPDMSSEIMGSDYGAEIGYFLAKNPAEALRLSKLSLRGIAKEIGKLEYKFTQAMSKLTTSAPETLTPVRGDDVLTKDPSKMSINEWMAWDKKRTLEKIKTQGVI